uniref:Uncharacterized protein n=1 Tax=Strigamia maritima TaxID=126957 RepID=T1J1F0_STRMM
MTSISDTEVNANDVTKDESTFYGISDPAPWSLSILSGIQHFLAMLGSTVPVPYLLFPYYCIGLDNPVRADIAAALYFVCGITTILQSAIGCRLPIMQGTTFSYFIPIFVLFGSPSMKCLNENVTISTGIGNVNINSTSFDGIWQQRISMVQGSLMCASLLQIALGITGLIGYCLPYITPLVIFPVQTLYGFAVLEESVDYCSGNWLIAILTVLMLIIFTEPLKNIHLPIYSYSKTRSWHRAKSLPIFQLFPVLMVVTLVWILCIILTKCDVFSVGNAARTDVNSNLITRAKWFRVPYPTQWGLPSVNLVCFIGMLGSSVANVIVAVGNYYICARMSTAPPPPIDAINRGILIEGMGTFLDGLIGIGNGSSSYPENIGIIGMTKMASRRVMYTAGAFMILIGVFTKLSAVFMVIPTPILGGVFLILFCIIASMGISTLQYVDLSSTRNLLVIGLPVYCGLAFPLWLRTRTNSDSLETGYDVVDGILNVFLRTGMFLGGVIGILLDNLLPGTPEERGLVNWNALKTSDDSNNVRDYDFPLKNFRLRKTGCLNKMPLCP